MKRKIVANVIEETEISSHRKRDRLLRLLRLPHEIDVERPPHLRLIVFGDQRSLFTSREHVGRPG